MVRTSLTITVIRWKNIHGPDTRVSRAFSITSLAKILKRSFELRNFQRGVPRPGPKREDYPTRRSPRIELFDASLIHSNKKRFQVIVDVSRWLRPVEGEAE